MGKNLWKKGKEMTIDEVKDMIDEQGITEAQYEELLLIVDKRIAELEGKIH